MNENPDEPVSPDASGSTPERPWYKRPSLAIKIIGLVLFAVICWRIDLGAVGAVLRQADPFWFFASLGLGFGVVAIRSQRWRLILGSQAIDLRPAYAYGLTLIGNSLGALTPGRIGELVRSYYLSRKGHSVLSGIQAGVIDRLWDIGIYSGFALTGLYFYRHYRPTRNIILALAALALLVGILIYFSGSLTSGEKMKSVLGRFVPRKYRDIFLGAGGKGRSSEKTRKRPVLIGAVSVAAYGLTQVKFYCLGRAVGIEMSPLFIIVVLSFLLLVRLLPITVLNMGSREAVLLFTFNLEGLSSTLAMAYSFAILADMLFFIGVGYFLSWVWRAGRNGTENGGQG